METKQELVGALAHWLAAGKLEARPVLPALEKLAGEGAETPSLIAALETLSAESDDALAALAAHLRETLRKEALQAHLNRNQSPPIDSPAILAGLPLDVVERWRLDSDPTRAVESAIQLAGDLSFAAANQEKAPRLFREINARTAKLLQRARAQLLGPLERLPFSCLKELRSALMGETPDRVRDGGGEGSSPGNPGPREHRGGESSPPPSAAGPALTPIERAGRDAALAELDRCWMAARRAWLDKTGRCLREPTTAATDPAALDEEALLATLRSRFAAASNRDEQARLIDCACGWLTPAVAPALREMRAQAWAQDRVMLNLTLRFGEPVLHTGDDWQRWLSQQATLWHAEQQTLLRLAARRPEGFLLVLYSQSPDPDPSALDALTLRVSRRGPAVETADLLQRWASLTPPNERRALLGLPEPSSSLVPPVIGAVRSAAAAADRILPPGRLQPPAPPAPPVAVAPVRPEPATPPRPSIWRNHVQPFFAENWYIVAGIAMVIFGSSLLAYFTWDKHWALRYTIMPSLLGLFTWSLAGTGAWIEKKSAEFKGTAAILRGAAIALLPINFMATAVLSADPSVPQKGPALLIMVLVYLSVFGWGLRQWCSAVEPALGNLLAGALLLLNTLVVVGPLASTVGHLEGQPLLLCLGAGFYLGFLVAAGTLVRFTRHILTREMAEEKRAPWFIAASLAITFLQVFLWVHGFMRHLPQAPSYAVLIILTGWLVLYAERRALELKGSPRLHGGESFLGFALILLGVLMGFSQPTMRIVCFAAAGAVWLYQALSRQHPLHYWIALTLCALAGASVGLLPSYPGPWLPLVGVVLALGFGLGNRLSQTRDPELAGVCRGMQVLALILTTLVAALAQWHYRSAPLATAAWLAIVATVLAWRAVKDQKVRWLHGTLVILALLLPYAGFMDVAGHSARHNTMVFGLAALSWLWLGVARWRPAPLVLQARSTGLWFYGALALAAMGLRVLLGDAVPEALWYRDVMDYLGPILMMLALVPATYHSRSLAPAGMAVAIMAILFPELRANLEHSLPWLEWGSGLGSALCGLGLVGLCFWLRSRDFLKNLPEGDRFMGGELFPFRRLDHTLFTWPILGAALFLIAKVDTWTLAQNELTQGIQLKTAVALGITGIAWTFIAIYHREQRGARVAVHLGWLAALAGLGFGYWHRAADPHWSWPFLALGLLLQALFWLYRFQLQPARPWVGSLLTEPTRQVLLRGSGLFGILCIGALLAGAAFDRMPWLCAFLAAQLIWHALASRQRFFASLLFFLVWIGLLAVAAPGSEPLWARVSTEHGLTPTLWLLAAIQLLLMGLEWTGAAPSQDRGGNSMEVRGGELSPPLLERLAPLVLPPFALASGLTALLGLAGLADGLHSPAFSAGQQALLLGVILLAARGQICNLILLSAMLLGYEMIHRSALAAVGSPEAGLDLLSAPWHLALLGLGMTLLTQGGCLAIQRRRGLLAGPFAQPFFAAPSRAWIFWPAVVLAAMAAARQTLDPALRESAAQLWAPYLGAVTLALVARFWRRGLFFAGAGLLLFLANIHLVRVFGGPWLRGHGLSELHLICLGSGLTLLQASALRRTLRPAPALAALNRACLGLAGLVLALLTVNYITAPNVADIQSTRFVVSGALAWLAGQYFRRAARHPEPGEEGQADLCEALYHFGVVLAIWCAALLVPWLRQPFFTLIALALPLVYFYGRAELGANSGLVETRRYRNSAAVLGFVVLGLYVFKAALQVVMFPGETIPTQYYHYNAPLILLLAVMLLRLHGLGGAIWLAFYGGLALMTGSYFLLTALPGFSPFDNPMPAAWCALALGHFWILLSYARSPLRTFIQRLARLDDPHWHSLRRYWGLFLLAATQGVTFLGLADYARDTYMVAPLLAGTATILLHQGGIRRSALYLVFAAVEFTLALHIDFLIPSYLPKNQIIWTLLGLWLALLAVPPWLPRKLAVATTGRIALALAILVLGHVGYHHPWTATGLWGLGLGSLLAAWNPMRRRQADNAVETACAALLLAIPIGLIYFSQAPFETAGWEAAIQAWPVLAGAAALFLVGSFARWFPLYGAAGYFARPRSQYRLFDTTLSWLELTGPQVHRAALWVVLGVAGAIQIWHYQAAFATREFAALTLLEAALAVAWFHEARDRQSLMAGYLMQIAALACGATIRRHLMLTTTFWHYEYDIWASLFVSFVIAGAKQILDVQPRSLRAPLVTTLFVVPATALAWVIFHGLGVDLALIVVGMHSVLFAYLGKDNRESPYNIVALGGFVGFVLLTFYTKLQFQAVHAYVIPVGLGILALQHLFQQRIPPETRNWIRLATLMAMLGSSGYYALADDRHAIAFNVTMILLGLLAMGLGSLLRIRLYLALGFAGLTVDLVSLLYKVLVSMERSARMTVVGSLVLLLGALVVFGAIYYKTNQAAFDAWVDRWRRRLLGWE